MEQQADRITKAFQIIGFKELNLEIVFERQLADLAEIRGNHCASPRSGLIEHTGRTSRRRVRQNHEPGALETDPLHHLLKLVPAIECLVLRRNGHANRLHNLESVYEMCRQSSGAIAAFHYAIG